MIRSFVACGPAELVGVVRDVCAKSCHEISAEDTFVSVDFEDLPLLLFHRPVTWGRPERHDPLTVSFNFSTKEPISLKTRKLKGCLMSV